MAGLPAVVQQHAVAAVEAQANGDMARANEHYQAELAARGAVVKAPSRPGELTPLGPAPEALSPDRVEAVLQSFDDIDAEEIEELRRIWPGESMAQNLGFGAWVLGRYLQPQDIAGCPDWAGLLRVAATLGRGVFHELQDAHHAPTSRRSGGTTEKVDTMMKQSPWGISLDDYEDTLRGMREQAQAALDRGDSKRANRIYAQQLEFIEERVGSEPIVGSQGRTA